MKKTISKAANFARRALLSYQARTLEAQLDGMDECMECVKDPLTRNRIIVARPIAQRELARIRAEYSATFPAGVRFTWRTA